MTQRSYPSGREGVRRRKRVRQGRVEGGRGEEGGVNGKGREGRRGEMGEKRGGEGSGGEWRGGKGRKFWYLEPSLSEFQRRRYSMKLYVLQRIDRGHEGP